MKVKSAIVATAVAVGALCAAPAATPTASAARTTTGKPSCSLPNSQWILGPNDPYADSFDRDVISYKAWNGKRVKLLRTITVRTFQDGHKEFVSITFQECV